MKMFKRIGVTIAGLAVLFAAVPASGATTLSLSAEKGWDEAQIEYTVNYDHGLPKNDKNNMAIQQTCYDSTFTVVYDEGKSVYWFPAPDQKWGDSTFPSPAGAVECIAYLYDLGDPYVVGDESGPLAPPITFDPSALHPFDGFFN